MKMANIEKSYHIIQRTYYKNKEHLSMNELIRYRHNNIEKEWEDVVINLSLNRYCYIAQGIKTSVIWTDDDLITWYQLDN